LISTRDGGITWNSMFNRQLFTLQVYFGNICFSASYGDGLVAAGLQDNGDVTCRIGHHEPWREFQGGTDGGIALCLESEQILYTYGSLVKPRVFRYGGSGSAVPLTVPKPPNRPDPDGVGVSLHLVSVPIYRNSTGQLIQCLGTEGNDLYGAFARADS